MKAVDYLRQQNVPEETIQNLIDKYFSIEFLDKVHLPPDIRHEIEDACLDKNVEICKYFVDNCITKGNIKEAILTDDIERLLGHNGASYSAMIGAKLVVATVAEVQGQRRLRGEIY